MKRDEYTYVSTYFYGEGPKPNLAYFILTNSVHVVYILIPNFTLYRVRTTNQTYLFIIDPRIH